MQTQLGTELAMKRLAQLVGSMLVGSATVVAVACLASAQDLMLTGTWQGLQRCKGVTFSGVELPAAELTDDIKITQSQTFQDDLSIQIGTHYYHGQVSLEPGSSRVRNGRATLIQCDSNPALSDYSEMVVLRVVLKNTAHKSKLAGVSVFRDPSANTKGAIAIGTCRWSYTRTANTLDPGVPGPGCP